VIKKIIFIFIFLLLFFNAYPIDYHWCIGYYDVQKLGSEKSEFWEEYYIFWGHQGIAAAEYFLGLNKKWIAVYFIKQDNKWEIYYINTTISPGYKPSDNEIYASLPEIMIWALENVKDATVISYNYITKSVRIKFHPRYDKNYNFYKRKLKIIKKKYKRDFGEYKGVRR